MDNTITEVPGIKVGHASNFEAETGCTVILCERKFQGSCEVRGGAPGTRETALLSPEAQMDEIHGVMLTGGSAFGLEAAGGVMDYLEERNIGFDTGVARVPIVPAGVIFDLAVGNPEVRPDRKMGYKACEKAASDFITGKAGAGTGATVGKIRGIENCMRSGVGTASNKRGDLVVRALAVVNAFGDIKDPDTGKIIAGAKDDNGEFINSEKLFLSEKFGDFAFGENTTLVVVATNASLSKGMNNKMAQMAHDGMARAIAPVHTMLDGDIVFTLNSSQVKNVDISILGTLAAKTVAEAVVDCVR
ncbi:MAG: P1 family peptidase [Bacillota bacterium]